jgi:glycosyltransferase involved in cell wall biosynthesis
MVGALDRRIDAAALATAARALPAWELRLAGGVEDPEIAALGGLANVELTGEIPYPAVPGFLAGLDVALVPYRDLPITRAIDPVKLYEAFAAGLPVVARRLPGLAGWAEPLVRFYDLPEELAPAIEAARAADTPELRRRRREAIAEHTWDRRAADLRRAIDGLGGG